jgi:type VI protein secretion system component Hcp
MHHIDKASPLLLKACATGQHLKEADHNGAQGRQGPAGIPDNQDE